MGCVTRSIPRCAACSHRRSEFTEIARVYVVPVPDLRVRVRSQLCMAVPAARRRGVDFGLDLALLDLDLDLRHLCALLSCSARAFALS